MTTTQIAKHFRAIYFGKNWTWSNLEAHLSDVTWKEATTPVYGLNTIATLAYHIHYFVSGVLPVLQGGPLDIKDKYSFEHPPIKSQEDWAAMLQKMWTEARQFADLIEQVPDAQLWSVFVDEKYGNYYRNFHGIIEHSHYHLGQIVVIKKIIRQQAAQAKPN